MALEPALREVATLALALPEADGFVLAGGGAMIEHGLVDRRTVDLDLFAPQADRIPRLAVALQRVLPTAGWTVEVVRDAGTFMRLQADREGETVVIDLAQDARMRPAVRLEVGNALAVDELAADKVLALFSRAQSRDLVDVDALRQRFTDDELFSLAREKDSGFDTGVFASGLRAASRRATDDFVQTGVPAEDVAALRERAQAWAEALEARPDL